MKLYKEWGYAKSDFLCSTHYVLPILEKILSESNSKILDVGCGNGSIANYLISKGFDVYGIDASTQGITIANQSNPGRFFVQDLDSPNLPDELAALKFNTIISTEVIEHLYAPRTFVAFCKKILMESGGGEFILSTPYNGYLKNILISLFDKWDHHLNPLWDGGHIKYWSRSTLTQLLREQNFEIIDFKGAGRIPYLWKSMLIKAKI
jgi:2-polyprenyl-3-methyl-5-hydroxy-6-metoxy-1,4-benzoquinol methylase